MSNVMVVPAGARASFRRLRAQPWLAPALLAGSLLAAGAQAQVSLAQLPQAWRDDTGGEFPLRQLLGRRVILTMAYASCHRICPMTLQNLARMQAELDQRGEAADFIVIGYDPDHERPSAWHAYRREHGLTRENWHFLTGSPSGTDQLARQLNFEYWRYDEHVMHDSRAIVFDTAGVQRATLGPDDQSWSAVL